MKWYEESWYAKNVPAVKNVHYMHCPVCKGYLGERREGTFFKGHCEECLTTFSFSPGDDNPSCTMDSKTRAACQCMSCHKDDPEPDTSESEDTKPYYVLPDNYEEDIP
jgi:hypothetical protein